MTLEMVPEVLEGTNQKRFLFIDLIQSLMRWMLISDFVFLQLKPNLCTHEIIDFVANSKHFMPHFHMPLQSGDNEIFCHAETL